MYDQGLSLKEMNLLLLKKVEELTLHLIEMEKRMSGLESGTSPLRNSHPVRIC
jgi:hypothetical protein